ncbi:MAG: type II secretion system protein GspK [Gammaproteobacteria bacterium]|jgi:general secretion pathway protein K
MAHSRGIALIAVLWFVVLLSLIASAFLSVSRGSIRETDAALAHARAEALADSGIELAVLMLLEPAHREALKTDGGARSIRLGGGEIAISIQDVAGRVDLNESEPELLAALFRSVGVPEERAQALAAAVADWRDADNERQSGGAEAADYRRAGLGHVPANRPFYSVSELRQVLGIDRTIFAGVAPSLTVYSGSPDVIASVAAPPVLDALRQSGAAIVTSEEIATSAMVPRFGITASGRASGGGAASLPPSDTDTYAIRAEAVLTGGGRFVREAVVILTGDGRQPYVLQSWGTQGE